MDELLASTLEAAIMLDIMALRQQGGPDDWHVEEAQKRLQAIRESNEGEAIFFKMPGTARAFQAYAECIAVFLQRREIGRLNA